LRIAVDELGSIVIDPDSRLTQLGLIPICDDSRYFFFESRAYGGELQATLPRLTAGWLSEVFDIDLASAYVAPQKQDRIAPITVSWGVGENANKRIDDEFEYEILAALLNGHRPVLLDRGAGGEEAARVDALVHRLGSPDHLHIHNGSYASFASHILQSRLYIGYDSAGQHVAAAGRVPLVSIFNGYACERMLSRWRPDAASARVITVDETSRSTVLSQTVQAIAEVGAGEAPAASRD
jgi:hypothetical protein